MIWFLENMIKRMRKEKKAGVIFIIVALVLSFAAVAVTYASISRITREGAIWIAAQDIFAGDPLSSEMFTEVRIPVGGIPRDAIFPGTDLDGLIAMKDMNERETLRTPNVADLGVSDLPILSSRLRALDAAALGNMEHDSTELHKLRAGEIPITSIVGMVSGMKKGDKISVTSVFQDETEAGNRFQRAETIFDYIRVIDLRPPVDNRGGTLVVALTNRQFEALALAREKGEFYISLMAFGIMAPENHPEILSQLYATMLDNPDEVTQAGGNQGSGSTVPLHEDLTAPIVEESPFD